MSWGRTSFGKSITKVLHPPPNHKEGEASEASPEEEAHKEPEETILKAEDDERGSRRSSLGIENHENHEGAQWLEQVPKLFISLHKK